MNYLHFILFFYIYLNVCVYVCDENTYFLKLWMMNKPTLKAATKYNKKKILQKNPPPTTFWTVHYTIFIFLLYHGPAI